MNLDMIIDEGEFSDKISQLIGAIKNWIMEQGDCLKVLMGFLRDEQVCGRIKGV